MKWQNKRCSGNTGDEMAAQEPKWQRRRRSGSAIREVAAQAVEGGTCSEVAAQAVNWQGPSTAMVHAVFFLI